MRQKRNGYSISSDRSLNQKLAILKRMLGCCSFKQLIETMLACPTTIDYLFDAFRDTAFKVSKKMIRANETDHEPSGLYRVLYVPKTTEVVKE